jgi:hypothetical protein
MLFNLKVSQQKEKPFLFDGSQGLCPNKKLVYNCFFRSNTTKFWRFAVSGIEIFANCERYYTEMI